MIRQGYFRLVEKHEKTEDLKDDYNNAYKFKNNGRRSKVLSMEKLFKSKELRDSQCDWLR